ncbi:MAG: DUF1573 domain-containing protein [Thermoguttaceae bacterium]|nr:DUF1573 domain-containing protein [Thermoguttaceae bacterium]
MTRLRPARIDVSYLIAAMSALFLLIAAGRALFVGIAITYERLSPESLVCEEGTYDFGAIDSDSQPEHEFRLRNVGRKPVQITKVRSGCSSCVEPLDYPAAPIPPGEEAVVKARLLSQNLSGKVEKGLVVKYGTKKTKYLVLSFKADVRASRPEASAE